MIVVIICYILVSVPAPWLFLLPSYWYFISIAISVVKHDSVLYTYMYKFFEIPMMIIYNL